MKLSWIKQFLSDELDALKIGLPLYFYILGSVTVSLQAINYFAARMGDGYLAGLGLGSAVTSASIFMFMLGFSSVFDVYGPQLCGQNKQKDLGKLLVKMLVQGFVAFKLVLFPYVLLVFCFDKIPLPEGNEHGKAQAIAQDFMYKMTITGYLDFVIETFIKFLVNQRSVMASYCIALGQTSSTIVFCWFFIIHMGMKTNGLVLSLILSRLLVIGFCVGVSVWNREDWNMNRLLNRNTLTNWGEMFKCGMASGLNLFTNNIAFLVLATISQVGGQITMEVIPLCIRLEALAWTGSVAISYSAAIMIGNAMGEGDVGKVKYMMGLNLFNCFLERVCFIAIYIPMRFWYFSLFTDDPVVLARVLYEANLWLGVMVLQNLKELLGRGVLIVMGKAVYVSAVTTCGACLVGVPIMCFMAYATKLESVGLVIGLLAERVVEVSILAVSTFRLDITKEIQECKERLEKEQESVGTMDITDTLVDNENT